MNQLLKVHLLRHLRRPPPLLFVRTPARCFSTEEKKEAQEYVVNEKEIFSEEKMAEARQSIKDKLKAISQQQEKATHDPRDFEFTKHHRVGSSQQQTAGQSVYFYSKPLKFGEGDSTSIFQMNTDIYQTANLVDTMVTSFMLFSTYKFAKQFYILFFGVGFAGMSIPYTVFWGLMIAAQMNYLTQTYLRQVFLVSEIDLMKNLEEIRIKTVLQDSGSVFSMFGKNKQDNTQYKVVKISDVRFSEKDQANSPIIRIIAEDQRYYMHKNMSKVQDFELLKAVMSPHVRKIECFR